MNKQACSNVIGSPTLVTAVICCVLITGCAQKRLDENLCPMDNPISRQTILLLDTSDPLTPKHRAELRRLLDEMLQNAGNAESEHFYIAPGEALIVYELTEDLDSVKSALKICNPGNNPDEWEELDALFKGKAIAFHQWSRLEENIEALFSDIKSSVPQASSPILEMLGVIVPQHAPSKRSHSYKEIRRTHLILFSDLLQHSNLLSHYRPYPTVKDIKTTAGLRSLQTDLAGIDVSLFRLERADAGQWQTTDHYYWWKDLALELGGALKWQQSI